MAESVGFVSGWGGEWRGEREREERSAVVRVRKDLDIGCIGEKVKG